MDLQIEILRLCGVQGLRDALKQSERGFFRLLFLLMRSGAKHLLAKFEEWVAAIANKLVKFEESCAKSVDWSVLRQEARQHLKNERAAAEESQLILLYYF
jgi:hypothetical protein